MLLCSDDASERALLSILSGVDFVAYMAYQSLDPPRVMIQLASMKLTTTFTSLLRFSLLLLSLSQVIGTVVSSPLPESKPPARNQKDSTWDWERGVHEVGVRATLMAYRLEEKDSEPGEGTTAWFKRAPIPGFIGVRKPVG